MKNFKNSIIATVVALCVSQSVDAVTWKVVNRKFTVVNTTEKTVRVGIVPYFNFSLPNVYQIILPNGQWVYEASTEDKLPLTISFFVKNDTTKKWQEIAAIGPQVFHDLKSGLNTITLVKNNTHVKNKRYVPYSIEIS